MASDSPLISICKGDLCEQSTDAIVNAANSRLRHGGGVAKAIRIKGGPTIQEESKRWIATSGLVQLTQCAVTTGGLLPCKHVIHAVGPDCRIAAQRRNAEKSLHDAAFNAVSKAHEMGLASVALPAISSGIFGFSKELCAHILLIAAGNFCELHGAGTTLKEIVFCNFDDLTTNKFAAAFDMGLARDTAGGCLLEMAQLQATKPAMPPPDSGCVLQ